MSGKSSSSIQALQQMQQKLRKFNQAQTNVLNSLKRDYQTVGGEWKDKKYQELGQIMNQVANDMKKTEETITQSLATIKKLEAALQQYLDTKF